MLCRSLSRVVTVIIIFFPLLLARWNIVNIDVDWTKYYGNRNIKYEDEKNMEFIWIIRFGSVALLASALGFVYIVYEMRSNNISIKAHSQ